MSGSRTAAKEGCPAWNSAANRDVGGKLFATRQIAARENRLVLRRRSCHGAEEVVNPAI